jgi:hypothetical protein
MVLWLSQKMKYHIRYSVGWGESAIWYDVEVDTINPIPLNDIQIAFKEASQISEMVNKFLILFNFSLN